MKIKLWAEDDQPRSRLKTKGAGMLSDSELLAILIGSGNVEQTAIEVCQGILASVSNDLDALAKMSLRDLMLFKGIGEAKAVTIAAALELGRRRQMAGIKPRTSISSSRLAYEAIAPYLSDKAHEEFWVLYLNRANHVLDRLCVSQGGVSATFVDARLIFKKAVELLASSLILCHNHPSGQLKPSQHDLELTRKLKEGGKLLDLQVVDHLIVGTRAYISLADEGLM